MDHKNKRKKREKTRETHKHTQGWCTVILYSRETGQWRSGGGGGAKKKNECYSLLLLPCCERERLATHVHPRPAKPEGGATTAACDQRNRRGPSRGTCLKLSKPCAEQLCAKRAEIRWYLSSCGPGVTHPKKYIQIQVHFWYIYFRSRVCVGCCCSRSPARTSAPPDRTRLRSSPFCIWTRCFCFPPRVKRPPDPLAVFVRVTLHLCYLPSPYLRSPLRKKKTRKSMCS